MKCEYFAMRRPGRKRERSQPSNSDSDRDRVIRGVEPHGNNRHPTALDLSRASHRLGSLSGPEWTDSDNFSGLLTPFDPNLVSVFEGENDIIDNLFTSPIDLSELGSNDFYNLEPDAIPETSSLDLPNTSKSSSLSSNTQSLLKSDSGVNGASDAASCCLIQALDLMRELSSTEPIVCTSLNGQNDVVTGSTVDKVANLSAQTVVAANQQTFESVSNMLQCSCAEDCYLLTMLSMIVLKALERYAAVARRQFWGAGEKDEKPKASTPMQEQVRPITSDGDESTGRLGAQLILGKLHSVQRLVKQLSPRLQARATGAASHGGGNSEQDFSRGDWQVASLPEDKMTKVSLSPTIFEQIDVDLRKALSALSSEIIEMLRQN